LEKLAFLGLVVNERANAAHAQRIEKGKVAILVMTIDEEQMIAQAVQQAFAAMPDEKGTM
jgi:acetate kinase